MDKQREQHIAEMKQLEEAMRKTTSPKLKRDYRKAWYRKQKQLFAYDQYRGTRTPDGKRTQAESR